MKIGLVLSGGLAKGAYQAGFLRAITRRPQLNITAISASSIGLLSGYAFAADKTDLLYSMWQDMHFDSTADLLFSVWFKHFLRDKVKILISESDEVKVPVYAPVCYAPFLHLDYCRMNGKYQPKWYSFVRSAMSFPLVSGGIRFFRGQIAVDGGLMDNIPVQPLLFNEDLDLILALHFEAGYKPRKNYIEKGIPILDYDVSLHNMFRKHSFDFHNETLVSMLQSGEEYGDEICTEVLGNGEFTLEQIKQAAEQKRTSEKQLRLDNITLDTWVRRANEVLYPLIKNEGGNVFDVVSKSKKKNHKGVNYEKMS